MAEHRTLAARKRPPSTETTAATRLMRDAMAQRRAKAQGRASLPDDQVAEMEAAANSLIAKTASWLQLPGGEVPSTTATGYSYGVGRAKNMLSDPTDNTRIAEDASLVRLELIGQHPLDGAPMALDASNSIQAQNSLEKMLMHEAATAHELGMRFAARAMECRVGDPHGGGDESVQATRYAGIASKMMLTYHACLVTLHKIRGAEQRITLQYVNVGPNEQAAVTITTPYNETQR